MAHLSLRINIVDNNVTKTIQFAPDTSVFDACRIIRDKISDCNNFGQSKDYGLFLPDDLNKGIWLEPGRNLDYYMLRNGDTLDYKRKLRTLKVKMLDGTIKTIMVDDSQPVTNLMVVICTKIGITNHDEYGLVREDIDNQENVETKSNFGTLTLKRKKDEKERDLKMEQLRKKLHTDDDINWIDPSKTLREQGIDENESVLLKRKFFFSDQNIDSRDPVQLNLLYVQARDAILNGTHPVTQENACEFAGLQCQIQFGDYIESKHKSGFLDLKEFLPQSYVKVKNIEKKIFAEHKKHQGVSELDAKVLYTKSARALKTYGVTFFLVKEKMKGKNKLVPRLLGVTKDSVLRLDEKTKEILKTWPLTTVRRWGASPNTFTLDFGDYSDQYYSVQTTEAEQILQLIAGYIDIILKKKKAKDHFGIEGDESSTMVEDSVSPLRATILQHEQKSKSEKINTESVAKPAVMRAGSDGNRTIVTGSIATTQYTMISGQINLTHTTPSTQETKIASVLSGPQKALMSTIKTGSEILYRSETELDNREELIKIGNDLASKKWKQTTLDTSKQMVSSQLAAMNAATAQVVTLTSGQQDGIDHTAVGVAINTISSNLPEMTKEVKTIAALMDDYSSGDKLIDATKKLCCAFTDLLKAAEPETKEPRQNLLNAASRVGEASHQVLYTIGEETEESKDLHNTLLSLGKLVANSTANLVLKARNIASTCETKQDQDKVIGGATKCALATSQLVACTRVVGPTILNTACQDQMITAVKEVAISIENLVSLCNNICHNEQLNKELQSAATEVSMALNDLLEYIKIANQEKALESVQESSVEAILLASDKLFASSGDSTEMVKQAGALGQVTAQLIQSIKTEAEKYPDSELKRRLLAAAKTLADATAKMVEAARICSGQPNDIKRQNDLRKAAEELRDITNIAASTPAIRNKLIVKLHKSVRETISIATQCLTTAHATAQCNNSQSTKDTLETDCTYLADRMPPLIDAIKQLELNMHDTSAQFYLIDESEQFLQPASHLVQSSRSVLPTLTDQAMSRQLSSISQQLAASLADLKSILHRSKMACHGHGLDAAIHIISNLKEDLNECYIEIENNELRPLPGDNLEKNSQQLGAYSKAVGHEIAQMLSAAQQSNETYTAQAARDTAYNLKYLAIAVRGVAATTSNVDVKKRIILSAQDVMINSLRLMDEARTGVNYSSGKVSGNLVSIAKDVATCLNRCVNCLPGQRDIDQAITNIKEMNILSENRAFNITSNKSFGQVQQELNNAAIQLNDASTKVVSSIHNASETAKVSKQFSNLLKELQDIALEIAGQTKESIVCNKIVTCIKNISTESIKLLTIAKSVSADLSLPNGKNQLAAAARAITESINQLVDVCTSTAPGQKECDNAIRKIQAMKPILDNPNESINDANYYECLDIVMEKSKSLGEGMTGITNFAKKSNYESFGGAVKDVSTSVCSLIEAAAQSAYLIGVSDSSSVSSKPGLVDQTQFARTIQDIQTGCQNLVNPSSGQDEVITAAELIAKRTSALCNICRIASSKTTNPVAKRQFIQSVKEVANATSTLVKEIKLFDFKSPQNSREKCKQAIKPLLESVDNLSAFAGSSEYASIPAKISQKARKSQEPIIESGYKIIDGSCAMVQAAKSLVLSPRDPPTWQLLANYSKNVSDSIKKLVNSIREKAPGKTECEEAISTLQSLLHKLDNASMDVVSQSLKANGASLVQNYFEQIEQSSAEISDKLEPVKQAAKHETENIGHSIVQMLLYFEPLITACIGAASNMAQSKLQTKILDQAKTVTESFLQLMYLTKDCGGNSKAINLHKEIDDSVQQTRDALNELTNHVERLSTQRGVVTGLIDIITRAMTRLTDHRASLISNFDASENYVDYQTRMVTNAKSIAKIAQELTNKSHTDPSKLAPLSADLAHKYANLANDSIGASACVNNDEVSTTLKDIVQALGSACVTLVTIAGQLQISKDDSANREISEFSRIVAEKVSQVLATLQSGSRGTQACINAVSTVSGIIGDLDTTIMFATAGTLHADDENETFSDHRENILKTAKALVEDTKTLVAGAASSQEQLAVAAQNAVATIIQLAGVVKYGAASLGSNDPDSQVMLINAVKDVASALGDLIHATKAASGKPINDPAMIHLKDSAKVMVTNVTSLLKTVKAVEDEHTRGTRALESTIEAISQEIRNLFFNDSHKTGITVGDLVKCTKAITQATVKAVTAGNSNKQADIISAANIGRKAISDMLIIAKANAFTNTETKEMKERILKTAQETAEAYRELLIAISKGSPNDAKHILPPISRKIAQYVTEFIAVAEILKGSDCVRPDDPIVIAENELLGAAASIDAAVKKLAAIKPREVIKENDDSSNFDEMILESAKSIAASTSALVKAASAAQRELIDSGKVSGRPLTSSDDGQWSEGLVSAARMVAAATHSLVESANSLMQGISSEEKLVSSAKQVASSTAQLLVACKVKADSNSDSMKKLQLAGNAVVKSTDNLVRAVQHLLNHEEQRSLILNRRIVGGIAQEINARTEVFRIEKQLLEARGRLTAIRQAKYKLRGADFSGDEIDLNSSSPTNCDNNSTSRYGHEVDMSVLQNQLNYSHLESPEKVKTLDKKKHERFMQHYIPPDDVASFDSYMTDYSTTTSESSSKFHYSSNIDKNFSKNDNRNLSYFRASTPVKHGNNGQQMLSCTTSYREYSNESPIFSDSDSASVYKKRIISRSETNCSSTTTNYESKGTFNELL